MNSRLLLTAAAIILLFSGCIPADQGASEEMGQMGPDHCPNLVGSWELVEIRESAGALSGEFESDPDYQEAPTLKVVNSTHWMFIRQTAGSFVHAQGGGTRLTPWDSIPSMWSTAQFLKMSARHLNSRVLWRAILCGIIRVAKVTHATTKFGAVYNSSGSPVSFADHQTIIGCSLL